MTSHKMICFNLIVLIWSASAEDIWFHLYDSDIVSSTGLHHQCLHYYANNYLIFGFTAEFSHQIIPFCFRPLELPIVSDKEADDDADISWHTFAELREENITAHELYIRSAPIDLIERYQMYLNNPNTTSSEQRFAWCRGTQFGDICQYMFDYENSFSNIVNIMFDAKEENKQELYDMHNNLTCYTHLQCNRGPRPMCLDWREVCDGKIDCIDHGLDEIGCDELEMNECDLGYYRCHNGAQCIPNIMLQDDPFNPDCLDGSDEFLLNGLISHCSSNPSFLCEERSCRQSAEFTSGDGICNPSYFIPSNNKLSNTRSELFRATIYSHAGNSHLTHDCWSSMICLTKNSIDEVDCNDHACWAGSSQECQQLIYQTCPLNFMFPATPVMFGHVYFMYSSNQSRYGDRDGPELFCYNASICPGFLPSVTNINNLTCCLYKDLFLGIHLSWNELMEAVENIFRACPSAVNDEENCASSNLFQCPNSSKCISKYRLIDGQLDCFQALDEKFNSSCYLKQQHRFKCSDEDKCLPLSMVEDGKFDCSAGDDEITTEQRAYRTWPPFPMLCDTYQDMDTLLIDGRNETDETDCETWPCDNIYTRCDGIWNCPNGHDEVNCPNSRCPPNEHLCISPESLNLTCIPLKQANDDKMDCLGGTDERMYCRQKYPYSVDIRYKCWNDSRCLSTRALCNRMINLPDHSQCAYREDQQLCPIAEEDQNTHFNRWWGICGTKWNGRRSLREELLCSLTDEYVTDMLAERQQIYTTFRHTAKYPQQQDSTKSVLQKIRTLPHMIRSQQRVISSRDTWFCNRGILVRMSASRERRCLCSSSYYGDRCEYQSQRVALTLQFRMEIMTDPQLVFSFIIMLIDDRNLINSYEKVHYIPTDLCDAKFNINLLYAMRPKNSSTTYYVRVDAYKMNTLQYHASWLLSIPFPFLPVNRVAALLTIPARPSQPSTKSCGRNGQSIRYENSHIFFCRCITGWSGRFCDILVKCDCSSDSFCFDNLNNRSICVCPLNRIGLRCYIKSRSCQSNPCANGGLCIPDDARKSEFGYRCVCNKHFVGTKCELAITTITISFVDLAVPPSIFAHFVTSMDDEPPVRLTKFQKIAYDQEFVAVTVWTPFHLLFVEITHVYYLTVVHDEYIFSANISTQLAASQRCLPVENLFNSTILKYHLLRRMKHYHVPCQQRKKLSCFYDEISMCLCNLDRQANCFNFNFKRKSNCHGANLCQNGAECLQDHRSCPLSSACICPECFYGSICQFTTKGLGISLDAVLGYQIQPNIPFSRQPSIVKFIVALVAFMSGLGMINSIFSIMVFQAKSSREVGCGLYLLVSSILSPITMIILCLKTGYLILSHMSIITNQPILLFGCHLFDTLLSILLAIGSWLNACVAMERALTVAKGASFDKIKSKKNAKWIITCVIISISLTELPDSIYRHLVHIEEEQRTWCMTKYPPLLKHIYSAITFIHFLIPLLINLISAISIIFLSARTRSNVRKDQNFMTHLGRQLRQHKHLLISPCFLIILALPRLLISSCMKSPRDPWLFITSYFLSFIPPILISLIFIVPSKTYRKTFKNTFKNTFKHQQTVN